MNEKALKLQKKTIHYIFGLPAGDPLDRTLAQLSNDRKYGVLGCHLFPFCFVYISDSLRSL